jgi:hypothetical protein
MYRNIKWAYLSVFKQLIVIGCFYVLFKKENIVTCYGSLIPSDHQSYSYSVQDAVKIGNSFITILNHT